MHIRIDHKCINTLSFHIMRIAHYRAFYNTSVHVNGIFYFCRSYTMTTYIKYIIYAAGNAVIMTNGSAHD